VHVLGAAGLQISAKLDNFELELSRFRSWCMLFMFGDEVELWIIYLEVWKLVYVVDVW
jgi:hypothetical protein